MAKDITKPDPGIVLDLLQAFRCSKVMFTALALGVFDALGSAPKTLQALSGAPRFNAWMADTIRPFVGERVLEIGAGIGNLTRALVPRRKLYVATDIDSEHLARLTTRFQHRPNMLIRFCDLARASDEAGQEQLEHLDQPVRQAASHVDEARVVEPEPGTPG